MPCRDFERGTVARESKRSLALPLFLFPLNKAQPAPSHGPSLPEYALHCTYLLKESTLVSRHVCTSLVNRLVLGDCEMIFNRDVQQELCNQASGTFDDLSHVFSWIRMPDDNELTLVSHADKAGLSKYVVKR